MPSTDAELQTLTAWLPQWAALKPIEEEISLTWARLKELRAQAADVRARLFISCPLELTELEIRFWSKVGIVDDEDSCWPWQGGFRNVRNENYGQFRWINPDTGVNEVLNAHRIAFFFANGHLPDHGRHTCDNPICVRPKHLLDGTHADNMRDRRERGRYGLEGYLQGRTRKPHQRGEENDYAVLTNNTVIEARRMAATGMTHRAVAERFGVDRATISFAVTGKTWSHLNDVAPPIALRPGGGKLTDDDVRTIRAEAAAGVRQNALATRFNVSTALVSKIISRKTHADVA